MVKAVVRRVYTTSDGREFLNEQEAQDHEFGVALTRVSEAGEAMLESAVKNPTADDDRRSVAAALEMLGRMAGDARRAAGEVKRTRKPAEAAAQPLEPPSDEKAAGAPVPPAKAARK